MKIRVTVNARAPRIIEIDDTVFEGADEEQRMEIIDDEAEAVANDMIDVGWEEVTDAPR